MARDYDLGVVVNPDVGDEQARAIVERITQTVTGTGGQVVRVNAWGRRHLAYPIEHHRDGLYFFFDLIMPPTAVAEVDRSIRVNEDIIRHLLVVRNPRAIQQQRLRDAEADARAAEVAAARAQAAAQAAEAGTREAELPAAKQVEPEAIEPEAIELDQEAQEAAEPEATEATARTEP
jgi:small subunit ribosomal protein S6